MDTLTTSIIVVESVGLLVAAIEVARAHFGLRAARIQLGIVKSHCLDLRAKCERYEQADADRDASRSEAVRKGNATRSQRRAQVSA